MRPLLAVVLLITACATTPMTTEPPPQAPENPDAVSAQMDQMRRRADDIIAGLTESSGPVASRHLAAAFELTREMRPLFGPANAWLFTERGHKLAALAKALGIADPIPSGVDLTSWDRFFELVDSSGAALTAKGLSVRATPFDTGSVGFLPFTPGRALRAELASRTLPARVPYAGAPGMPERAPAPDVHPSYTLLLVPPRVLTSRSSMVTREQPGTLVGAIEGALVFAQDPARSGDTDDGEVEKLVLATLFGSVRGVSAVCAPGILATSTRHVEGADVEVTVTPCPAKP
jgi:hypothetical protein